MSAEPESDANVRLRIASPAQETQSFSLQVDAWPGIGSVREPGEHGARVISLLSDHPVPRSRQDGTFKTVESPPDSTIPGGAITDEQAPQWIKALLPQAIDGRWDVYSRDGGFLVKLCWRDQRGQTVTFPRINFDQFQTMKQDPVEQVGETLRAKITDHLRSLLFDPEKRDKALAAAEKLGIDLGVTDVHNVHTVEIN